MAHAIVVIKIDPEKRLVAAIGIKPSTRGVAQVLGVGEKSSRILLSDLNGEKLLVGCRVGLPLEAARAEWRFRGCDNIAGVGILFGSKGGSTEYMHKPPVDVDWVRREIVWCEPGEVAPAAEVAELLGLNATPVDEN